MKHLVVPSLPPAGETLRLDAHQSHYLARVRRLSIGDALRVTDGDGGVGRAVVASLGDGGATVTLRMGERHDDRDAERLAVPVTLHVALLKGKKLDTVVRQATELGVDRIVPTITRRCVSRPEERDLERKRARWAEIAREAAQQSGRTHLPAVERPTDVAGLVPTHADEEDAALSLMFHEAAEEVFSLARFIHSGSADGTPPDAIRLLVGPEGGLAPDEVERLRGGRWTPVRMPLPVLRAETAAIAATTLVQALRNEYTFRSHDETQHVTTLVRKNATYNAR